MSNEFDIIQRYFMQFPLRDDVCLGIGDDAAVTQLPVSQELVITVDTLVAGVHFPDTSPARSIGHKSLAVNLSPIVDTPVGLSGLRSSLRFEEGRLCEMTGSYLDSIGNSFFHPHPNPPPRGGGQGGDGNLIGRYYLLVNGIIGKSYLCT